MLESILLTGLKPVSSNLFYQPLAGAEPHDPITVTASRSATCSTPGQDVYIDRERQCIITRTSSGIYVSQQKGPEALDAQIALLERLSRLHS